MKWQELDIAKLIKIVPGDTKQDKLINAFDIKYGDYDYSDDLRAVSHDELHTILAKTIESIETPKQNIRILIGGANNGYEVQFFHGCEITAIDLSKRALRKLNEKYPFVHTKVMNINSLEFSDSCFDVYCCLRSFQSYGVNLEKAISESIRVVKNKGVCIYSLPNGYIVNGSIQRGMYDPSRKIYNQDLPNLQVKEITSYLDNTNCTYEVQETQSEIVIKVYVEK